MVLIELKLSFRAHLFKVVCSGSGFGWSSTHHRKSPSQMAVEHGRGTITDNLELIKSVSDVKTAVGQELRNGSVCTHLVIHEQDNDRKNLIATCALIRNELRQTL